MAALGNAFIGIVVSAAVSTAMPQNFIEFLYPVVFLYHILTFSLTYPQSTLFRKFTITFFLSFSDILLTVTIFQLDLLQRLTFLFISYFILFYMSCQLTIDEITSICAQDQARFIIFTLTGYLNSVSLVSTLTIMASGQSLSEIKNFVNLFCVGVVKTAGSAGVYYLDKLSLGGRFDRLTFEEIWEMFRNALVGVCVAIEVCAYFGESVGEGSGRGKEYLFGGVKKVNLVTGMYFAGVYAYRSYQCGVAIKGN